MIHKFLTEIRKLRKSRGLSQVELADLIGTSQAIVSKMESGKGNPETATLFAAAAALDAEIVFVPRRVLKQVQDIVTSEIRYEVNPTHYLDPGSVADDVFIPDPEDEDEVDISGPRL